MKRIIDIPNELAEKEHWYTDEEMWTVIKAAQNGIPIPDNATRGAAVETLFSETLDNFCERTTWEWNRWWNTRIRKAVKDEN